MFFMVESKNTLTDQLSGLQQKYLEMEEANKSLHERILELSSLYHVSLALSKTLELDEILKSIKKLFKRTFNVDQYSIMLLDESNDQLKIASSYGISKTVRDSDAYEFGANIFGEALEQEELIYISEKKKATQYEFYPDDKNNKNAAFLTIPLKQDKGLPIGVLNLSRKKPDSFTEQEISLFAKVTEQIAKVIDKTLLFKHTKELSITDELTSIYNRRYFNQRFEREVMRAKRYKRPLSAIMIDIDHFKNYNDVNGHILGDDALKKVASLLDHNIRKADILARYGGEEFVLLLPEIDKEHSFKVAEKLRRTIETNSFTEEHKQPDGKLTISLGVSTLLEDTYTSRELINFADKALYEAKKKGRNRAVVYHVGLSGEGIKSFYPMNMVVSTSAK